MNNQPITKYIRITIDNVYAANVKRYQCKDGKTIATNFSINFGNFKNSTQQKWISCIYFGELELIKGDRIDITKAYLDYDIYNNKFGVPTIKTIIRVQELKLAETQSEQEIINSLPEAPKQTQEQDDNNDLEWFADGNE